GCLVGCAVCLGRRYFLFQPLNANVVDGRLSLIPVLMWKKTYNVGHVSGQHRSMTGRGLA
ncbi:MAG: hypothetical protein QMB27_00020, partial [Rhodospirillales bacterium]